MDTTTLLNICNDLETYYDLKPSRMIRVIENVAMFLYIITLGHQIGKCKRDFSIQVKLLADA
jgi:hypothetical protein